MRHRGRKTRVWTAGWLCVGILGFQTVVVAETSPFPGSWSFEEYAEATVFVDSNGVGIVDGWGGEASTSGVAVVTAEDYSAQYTDALPIVGTHSNVLAFEGVVSNVFIVDTNALWTNVVVDCMVRPGQLTFEPTLSDNPQLAMYVNTNGRFVVRHAMYGDGWVPQVRWTELAHDPIATTDWARVTIQLQYLYPGGPPANPFENLEHYFSVSVNGGAPIYSDNAYDHVPITSVTPTGELGGVWFLTADSGSNNPENEPGDANRNKWFTALELQGVGALDDLVVSGTGQRGDAVNPYQIWSDGYNLTNNAAGDDDDDGLSNWGEYLAGTIPTDPNSVFIVLSQTMANGTNWVTWMDGTNSDAVSTFLMYRSTNHNPSIMNFDWVQVGSGIPRSLTGTNVWPDINPPAVPTFYQPAVDGTEP